MRNGFTLIELLVVVLIIGILASIAMPQYNKAVLRARFADALQVGEALKKAHEVYYLANGHYIADTDNLDYDFAGKCTGRDVVSCDEYFYIDNLSGSNIVTDPNAQLISILYCPKAGSWTACGTNVVFRYTIWLDQSSHPGVRTCSGSTQEGRDFCKVLGFED